MQISWFETFATWLNLQGYFASIHNSQPLQRNDVPMDYDVAFPWEQADDEELIFYAALIASAHY